MTHGLTAEVVERILERSMPSFQLTSTREINLGLGYIYYGIARVMRPRKTVIVGSKAGFAPLCFARGIADNTGSRIVRIDCEDVQTTNMAGTLDFIDPGYSQYTGDEKHSYGIGYWKDPAAAKKLWSEFDVDHVVKHFKQTSAYYLSTLPHDFEIDLLFIDGDHSYEGIMHDLIGFLPFLGRESVVLAHDVDPMCHSARGYQVLEDLPANTYLTSRLPIYPGLAVMLPVQDEVQKRIFSPPPTIGGDHSA